MSSLKTKTYRQPKLWCDPSQPVETDNCAVCLEPFNNNQVRQYTCTLTWYFKDLEMQVILQQFFKNYWCVFLSVSAGAAVSSWVPQGLCWPVAAAAAHLSPVQTQHPQWVPITASGPVAQHYLLSFDLCRFLKSQLTAGCNASVLGSLWLKVFSPCHWWVWSEICSFALTTHTSDVTMSPCTPVHHCNKVRH